MYREVRSIVGDVGGMTNCRLPTGQCYQAIRIAARGQGKEGGGICLPAGEWWKTMRKTRVVRTLSALGVALLLLTSCQLNAFLRHYEGRRCSPVADPQVVADAPPDSALIGLAEFTSLKDRGDDEALAAARAVGAHYVEWSRRKAGTKTVREACYHTMPTLVFDPYASALGGPDMVPGDVPVAISYRERVLQRYAYTAKFYHAPGRGGRDPRE